MTHVILTAMKTSTDNGHVINTSKLKKALIIRSLIIKIAAFIYIVGGFILQPIIEDELLFANSQAYQKYFCETKYNAMMDRLDGSNQKNEDTSKMLYAMTFCLRNYKNGQQLNLQPLLDEINKTEPKTDYKAE